MIAFRAGAVFRVRDGFTGGAVPPSGILCSLDGRPCRPVAKREGYLVLLYLPAGPHRLSLRCRGYREEIVDFAAGETAPELDVTLKPGPGYPFRQAPVRLELRIRKGGAPAEDFPFWLAAAWGPGIKLAQARAEAGEWKLRLFCKYPDAVTTPAPFLLEDGADSELVTLRSLEGETGVLNAPLARTHGRGKQLLPVQRYRTGPGGTAAALFRSPCTVLAFHETLGPLGRTELAEGSSELELTIP